MSRSQIQDRKFFTPELSNWPLTSVRVVLKTLFERLTSIHSFVEQKTLQVSKNVGQAFGKVLTGIVDGVVSLDLGKSKKIRLAISVLVLSVNLMFPFSKSRIAEASEVNVGSLPQQQVNGLDNGGQQPPELNSAETIQSTIPIISVKLEGNSFKIKKIFYPGSTVLINEYEINIEDPVPTFRFVVNRTQLQNAGIDLANPNASGQYAIKLVIEKINKLGTSLGTTNLNLYLPSYNVISDLNTNTVTFRADFNGWLSNSFWTAHGDTYFIRAEYIQQGILQSNPFPPPTNIIIFTNRVDLDGGTTFVNNPAAQAWSEKNINFFPYTMRNTPSSWGYQGSNPLTSNEKKLYLGDIANPQK